MTDFDLIKSRLQAHGHDVAEVTITRNKVYHVTRTGRSIAWCGSLRTLNQLTHDIVNAHPVMVEARSIDPGEGMSDLGRQILEATR